MWTVTQLARTCGLSRTTVLYYERIGLVKPSRAANNYRRYGERELRRLRQIRAFRDAGLTLADIRMLLARPDSDASSVLKRRLLELDQEIQRVREHQRSILKLLGSKHSIWRMKMITKEKWVAVMRGAGFSDDDMHRWHAEFEKAAPQEHQEFLEFLHIPAAEIESIRAWSKAAG